MEEVGALATDCTEEERGMGPTFSDVSFFGEREEDERTLDVAEISKGVGVEEEAVAVVAVVVGGEEDIGWDVEGGACDGAGLPRGDKFSGLLLGVPAPEWVGTCLGGAIDKLLAC